MAPTNRPFMTIQAIGHGQFDFEVLKFKCTERISANFEIEVDVVSKDGFIKSRSPDGACGIRDFSPKSLRLNILHLQSVCGSRLSFIPDSAFAPSGLRMLRMLLNSET